MKMIFTTKPNCFVPLWLATVLVLLTGCSQQQKSGYRISDEPYRDWVRETYGKVVMIYPEGHMHASDMPGIASGYESAQRQICNFFEIPIPSDSIYVYYYTGIGQGREMTGREWVFADSNHLHFFMPSYLGVALMEYLIPKWIAAPPRHSFLRSGLIAFFDYSGQNYHEMTLNYIDQDIFITLDSLGRDTTSNVNMERWVSGEAASFIAFYLDTFGKQSFKNLYQAPDENFNDALRRETGLEVDSVETLWIEFATEKYEKYLESFK